MYSKPPVSILSLTNWYLFKLRAVCAVEFPLVRIDDAPASAAYAHSRIPPLVHQTWSSNRLGRTHARQIARFRDLNPELSFRLYDDAQMHAYMDEHWGGHPIHAIYKHARYAQLATDIFRYCLIHDRGGFYFDISKGLRVPICSLLRADSTGLITYERRLSPDERGAGSGDNPYRDNVVAQYGFGFAPGHPLLGIVIDRICRSYPSFKGAVVPSPKEAILRFTGPDMFTAALRDYMAQTQDGGLVQAGVDFNGEAIWKMKGSYVRFFSSPPYKYARSDAIVD
jgi:mannosyltransferase OCH1-like enzyme